MGTWTEGEIRAACVWIAERLAADFEGTGLPAIEFRIDPAWRGAKRSSHAGPEDVILACGGHEFPLHLEGGLEQACGYAAYQLQDDVVGDARSPWPELIDGSGSFVGVLTPAGPPGLGRWELRGEPFCAIGHLHRAVQVAGLTIATSRRE